jgi:hypothetical protein
MIDQALWGVPLSKDPLIYQAVCIRREEADDFLKKPVDERKRRCDEWRGTLFIMAAIVWDSIRSVTNRVSRPSYLKH